MTSEEFHEQLAELLNNAPEDAAILFLYHHDDERQIEYLQANTFSLLQLMSFFLADREDICDVFKASIAASYSPVVKEYKKSLKK